MNIFVITTVDVAFTCILQMLCKTLQQHSADMAA